MQISTHDRENQSTAIKPADCKQSGAFSHMSKVRLKPTAVYDTEIYSQHSRPLGLTGGEPKHLLYEIISHVRSSASCFLYDEPQTEKIYH